MTRIKTVLPCTCFLLALAAGCSMQLSTEDMDEPVGLAPEALRGRGDEALDDEPVATGEMPDTTTAKDNGSSNLPLARCKARCSGAHTGCIIGTGFTCATDPNPEQCNNIERSICDNKLSRCNSACDLRSATEDRPDVPEEPDLTLAPLE